MNAKHIEGDQYPMVLSRGELAYSKSESLTILPLVEEKAKASKDQSK